MIYEISILDKRKPKKTRIIVAPTESRKFEREKSISTLNWEA